MEAPLLLEFATRRKFTSAEIYVVQTSVILALAEKSI